MCAINHSYKKKNWGFVIELPLQTHTRLPAH
jgi:hypothetical protein